MGDGKEEVVPAVATLDGGKTEFVMNQFGINRIFASQLIEID